MLFAKRNPFASPRPGNEVLDGVHLLGSHRVNFYVVEDGRSLTLFDCGFAGHRRYLDAWLGAHDRSISDIEAIVLTHGHADHFGFAEDLRKRGIPVYLTAADADYAMSTKLRGGARIPPQRLLKSLWRPSAMALLMEAACDGVFAQPLLGAFEPLEEGGTLDVPGKPVVVPVPAHSPGSVAFHLPRQHALLTGDALMTRDPMIAGPDRAIVFADHTDRNDAALAALEYLRPHADAVLLPAHGDPWLERGSVGRAIGEAVIAA